MDVHTIQIEGAAIHFLGPDQAPVLISFLYTPPDERRKGLARRLIRAAKDKYPHLILSVQPDNPANVDWVKAFYESEGFRQYGWDPLTLEYREHDQLG